MAEAGKERWRIHRFRRTAADALRASSGHEPFGMDSGRSGFGLYRLDALQEAGYGMDKETQSFDNRCCRRHVLCPLWSLPVEEGFG